MMYQLVEKMHNLNSYYISPAVEDAGNVWDTTEVGLLFCIAAFLRARYSRCFLLASSLC